MYKLFLSFRYFFKPLSIVSVVMLGFSVMALTAAPSVMNGFQADFHARIRGTQSDLSIWSERPIDIERSTETERAIRGVPGVAAVAPYIEYPAIDRHFRNVDYCFIRAVEPRFEEKVSELRTFILSDRDRFLALNEYDVAKGKERTNLEELSKDLPRTAEVDKIYKELEEGAPDPDDPSKKLPAVLAGIFYLRAYDMDVGSVCKLTTATEGGEVQQDKRFVIVGAFRTGTQKQDRQFLYMGLGSAQQFIGVPDRITGYSVKLVDYDQASIVKPRLKDVVLDLMGRRTPSGHHLLPQGMYVKTWEERDRNLLMAVGMERFLIKFIIFLMVIAASATIFLVVYMTSQRKIREIGILRSLGATRSGTFSVFASQGILLAVCGIVFGTILGLIFAQYLNEIAEVIHKATGWHPFPPEVYYLERIPSKIVWTELVWNGVATIFFGLVFAFFPALFAALRPPIRAIRYE